MTVRQVLILARKPRSLNNLRFCFRTMQDSPSMALVFYFPEVSSGNASISNRTTILKQS